MIVKCLRETCIIKPTEEFNTVTCFMMLKQLRYVGLFAVISYTMLISKQAENNWIYIVIFVERSDKIVKRVNLWKLY